VSAAAIVIARAVEDEGRRGYLWRTMRPMAMRCSEQWSTGVRRRHDQACGDATLRTGGARNR